MLIKAWCYYESRILGSHHGLISTYALEILVLYIFHLYHNYLDGPLAVSVPRDKRFTSRISIFPLFFFLAIGFWALNIF